MHAGILREPPGRGRRRLPARRASPHKSAQVSAGIAVSVNTETHAATTMPEKIDNLEALIDDILRGDAPMTLADLINLIAQPHRYDGLSLLPLAV
jgi:hypothetical protein